MQAVICAQHRALPTQKYDIPYSEVVRRETIGLYKYTLSEKNGQYFVTCHDPEKRKGYPEGWLQFGPFSFSQANEMIDSRVARHEWLRR